MKRRSLKKYGTGVQTIGAKPRAPEVNNDAMAQGALEGAKSGNPIGILTGLFTGLIANDKNKRAAREAYEAELEVYKDAKVDQLQAGTLDVNEIATQGNQAKDGRKSTTAKPIEVERNELVMRKSNGKYNIVKDFKSAPRHEEGGKVYKPTKGDVIFPEDMRDEVLAAHKSGNTPKLEALRLKLPTETTAGLAEDGLNTDPKAQYQAILEQVKAGNLPQSYADDFYKKNANALQENQSFDLSALNQQLSQLGYNVPTPDQSKRVWDEKTQSYQKPLGLTPDQLVEDLSSFTSNFNKDKSWVESPDQRLNLTPDSSGEAFPATKTPEAEVEVAPSTGGTGGGPAAPTGPEVQGIKFDPKNPFQVGPDFKPPQLTGEAIAASPGVSQDIVNATGGAGNLGNIAGYAGQIGAALFKTFPGEAERQESPDVRLNRLQYTDTSGQLRQQAAINEKVAASNARNVAGGNIQNYMATRKQAGIDKLRALQGIDAAEFRKRLGIANENRTIGDKETLINQGQFLKDQEVNAANRGARRSSIGQGISELGEIAGTMGRDKNAQVNQQQLLNTLNSLGVLEVLPDGSIGFKKTIT